VTERHDGRAWRRATVERAQTMRQAPGAGEVPRVVVEIETTGGERGLVTVSLRDGSLHAIDDRGERDSALALAALAWLEGMTRADGSSDPGLGSVRGDHAGARASLFPSLPPARVGLAAARDVSLALVRTGIAGARRGALDDHLRRARGGAAQRARCGGGLEQGVCVQQHRLDIGHQSHPGRGIAGDEGGRVGELVAVPVEDVAALADGCVAGRQVEAVAEDVVGLAGGQELRHPRLGVRRVGIAHGGAGIAQAPAGQEGRAAGQPG